MKNIEIAKHTDNGTEMVKNTPLELAAIYAEQCRMTESEWENFNNCLEGREFDEDALLKTLSDLKAVAPYCGEGVGTISNTFIPGKLMLTGKTFEVSEKTLLNYCYYDINREDDTCPERLPSTLMELCNWTAGMYKSWFDRYNLGFMIYINQDNDKFQCLVRLWKKYYC